jgi:hypothetical protein
MSEGTGVSTCTVVIVCFVHAYNTVSIDYHQWLEQIHSRLTKRNEDESTTFGHLTYLAWSLTRSGR